MLRDIRTNYEKSELTKAQLSNDPMVQLQLWLNEAIESKTTEPTSMIISSIDSQGNPDSRVVLLKEISPEGLIFFTNYKSQKAQQIKAHPEVSALMFWPSLERQVRIKGSVTKLSEADSTNYFKTRPRDSQLGAWASPQSEIIDNREQLNKNFEHYKNLFLNKEIPKPDQWGGFLIKPHYFEFWQGRSNRLHDRLAYRMNQQQWEIHRLSP